MSDGVHLTIDGRPVSAQRGQTIIEAADAAGIYVPRLCHQPGLAPYGGCRVCTVTVNGRSVTACTTPAAAGQVIESDTPALREHRRLLLEMLFVEGNHFCMFCEKSGACELQALAYQLEMTAPRFDLRFPQREVDASHHDVLIDHNRCILCGRCVRASRDVDGKHVFQFVGRGARRRLAVNAEARLAETDIAVGDAAIDACPVGALLRKREGFRTPIGRRLYDVAPIGERGVRRASAEAAREVGDGEA